MAHGNIQFQTDNIWIESPKATIGKELTVEGPAISFNNVVDFKNYVNFYYFASFTTLDGYTSKPQLTTQYIQYGGHTIWIECNFRDQYDTFWFCTDPLLTFDIYYYGGNHIVQFEIMTQEDLDMEPGDGFGFSLIIDDPSLDDKININKPFNFEPGKKYMIIFQQTEENGPINIFWTELTDYAN